MNGELPDNSLSLFDTHKQIVSNGIFSNPSLNFKIDGPVLRIFGPVEFTQEFIALISNCTTVYIDLVSFDLSSIPPHITTVYINWLDRRETKSLIPFTHPIGSLHNGVKSLTVYNFQGVISRLPESLEYLELDDKYPHPLPHHLLPNLQILRFAPQKNYEIDIETDNHNQYYNKQIPWACFPALIHLDLPKSFNKSLEGIGQCRGLQKLIIKGYWVGGFNGKLNGLPSERLQELVLELPYSILDLKNLPASIRILKLNINADNNEANIVLPENLEVLVIEAPLDEYPDFAHSILQRYKDKIDSEELKIVLTENGVERYNSIDHILEDLFVDSDVEDSDEEDSDEEDSDEEDSDMEVAEKGEADVEVEDKNKGINLLNEFDEESNDRPPFKRFKI
jgi:hypothetical protein